MIKAVQRRINRELSLVLSERTRQDTGLPTGKMKNLPLKHLSHTEKEMLCYNDIVCLFRAVEKSPTEAQCVRGEATDCGDVHAEADGGS